MTDSRFRSGSYGSPGVSRLELARFLRRLAELYKDPVTGNPALSSALLDLSRGLSREAGQIAGSPVRMPLIPDKRIDDLEKLDAAAVKDFIADEAKTKPELIELATVRFSIPHSRLMKMKTQDIRGFLRSALLHEDSIAAIAEQARRSGTHRSS